VRPPAPPGASRGSLLLLLLLAGGAAHPAAAQTTLPTLWIAGGLDAGSTGAGQAARMATDPTGNVAVVSGPATGRDLAVTSYTPGGTLRWRRQVSPASGTFAGDWVVVAPDGDVIAVGHSVDSQGRPTGITLVRYSTEGTLQWRVNLAPLFPSVARLVVDAAGDTYLAFSALGDGQDMVVHKYNASGVRVWAQVVNTGSVTNDIASSLTLSPDGADVILTGTVGANWITASFNALTGTRRWLVVAPEGIAARDVVADATRVYVAGQGVTGAGTPSIRYLLTVIAYNRSTGARLWRTDSTPAGSQAIGQRVALAPDGSLVAAGFTSSGGYLDWWTVALEVSGAVRWQARRDRALTGDESPSTVFTLADGTTVVSGIGGPVTRDVLGNSYMQGIVAGYDPSGVVLWEGYAKMGTTWAGTLPGGDVCAAGGYDALITCWSVTGAVSPPAAPSGLTARLSTGSVQLAWQDNATNETAYSVERATATATGMGPFVVLATQGANATTFADTTYTNTTYEYRVRASNAAGASAYSNTASISILSANDPPTAVMSATPSTGAAPLVVTFDGSGSTDLGGAVTSWTWTFGDGTMGTGVATTHLYSTPGSYVATLTVTDRGNLSDSTSRSIVVTAPATLPTAPSGLTVSSVSRNSIGLRWTNTGTAQTEVRIERCQGSNCTGFAQVGTEAGTATTFMDVGLAPRTPYTYRVRGHNAAGDSPYSNTAGARTLR
jgi:PKD repeat protein